MNGDGKNIKNIKFLEMLDGVQRIEEMIVLRDYFITSQDFDSARSVMKGIVKLSKKFNRNKKSNNRKFLRKIGY